MPPSGGLKIMLASELKEESELSLLRKEAAQLRTQLAEVKRVDDQELDKLWRLAESQSNQLAQDQARISDLESACADKEVAEQLLSSHAVAI
ncbi:hypothetical protein WJX84_006061 [Apatococcus fuscideae]|uniref:Uncharacterized protein n=1 Tax=Apatococcus fuscideae TaxID=2026836 RepID=A0AAW1TDT6_9CHLO